VLVIRLHNKFWPKKEGRSRKKGWDVDERRGDYAERASEVRKPKNQYNINRIKKYNSQTGLYGRTGSGSFLTANGV